MTVWKIDEGSDEFKLFETLDSAVAYLLARKAYDDTLPESKSIDEIIRELKVSIKPVAVLSVKEDVPRLTDEIKSYIAKSKFFKNLIEDAKRNNIEYWYDGDLGQYVYVSPKGDGDIKVFGSGGGKLWK